MKQKGKGHNLGPPFVWTAAGLLAGLKEKVSDGQKEELKALQDHWKNSSLEAKTDIF